MPLAGRGVLDEKFPSTLNDQPFLKSCKPAVRSSSETRRQLQHGPGRESNFYQRPAPSRTY